MRQSLLTLLLPKTVKYDLSECMAVGRLMLEATDSEEGRWRFRNVGWGLRSISL